MDLVTRVQCVTCQGRVVLPGVEYDRGQLADARALLAGACGQCRDLFCPDCHLTFAQHAELADMAQGVPGDVGEDGESGGEAGLP